MKNFFFVKPAVLFFLTSVLACFNIYAQKSSCEGVLATINFLGSKTATPVKPITQTIVGSKTATPVKPRDGNSTPTKKSTPYSQLTAAQIAILQKDAAIIKNTPDCQVKVSGHGSSTKIEQQLSWDRVNAVIRYLVEKAGISETRFIFEYGNEGDINTVDLSFTSEDGPQTAPAPHPNLRSM